MDARISGSSLTAWARLLPPDFANRASDALADGRPFLCGDAITLADLGAAVAAHYAETEGLALSPVIRAYQERLHANPVLRASADAARPYVEATRPRRQPAAAP